MAWNPLNEVKFKVATVGLGTALFFALVFREGYRLVNCGMGEFAINVPDKVYELTYDEDLPAEYTPGNVFETENTQTRLVHHNLIELSHVQSVNVTPLMDDLSALNYMTNVEYIDIDTTEAYGDIYRTIDGSSFKKPVTVKIHAETMECFNDNEFGFLKEIPVIDRLILGDGYKSVVVDSEFLNSLTNVRNLEVVVTVFSNIDFRNLTHLDSLTIKGTPYDVAIFLSNDDIKALEDAGVEVNITLKDELINVNKEIDDIVASLNITDDMTDQEKLNRAIAWVLRNYEYDDTSRQLIVENKPEQIDIIPFYREGYLTASLKGDGQICGNYAAMLNALLHRLNVESYFTCSYDHAWNTVKIDGEYYTIDTTNLDHMSLARTAVYAYTKNENDEIFFLTQEEIDNLPEDVEVFYAKEILEATSSEDIFESGNQDSMNNFKEYYMADVDKTIMQYDPLPQISYFIEPALEVKDYNEIYKNRLMQEFYVFAVNSGAWTLMYYIIIKSKVLKEDSKNFVKKIK